MVTEYEKAVKQGPVEGHILCPECGSDKRLIADFVAKLKEEGVISSELFPQASGVWEIPFMDLAKMGLIELPQAVRSFPKVRILFDICAECKRLLITRVEFGEGSIVQQSVGSQQKSL